MQQRKTNKGADKYNQKNYEWFYIVRIIVITIVVVLALSFLVLGWSRVDGQSMEPTLKNGQPVAYLRFGRDYKLGDIIAIKMTSGESYVKRIAGMPGDIIEVKDGALYRNGEQVTEDYIGNSVTKSQKGVVKYPYTVPEGSYWVLGDNREHSTDSRTCGAVIREDVKGLVLY